MKDLTTQPAQADGQVEAAQVQATLQNAVALHQQGDLAKAQAMYEEVLKHRPMNFDALHLSGIIAAQTKNHAQAAALIGKALQINPNSAAAHFNHGLALGELKQYQAAVDSYDHAIRLKADYAEAYNNRGNALMGLLQLQIALESYDRAIGLRPDFADAYFCRGIALQRAQQYDAALASFDKVLQLNTDHADAYFNRGLILRNLKRHQDALDAYDKALRIKPDHAEVYNNRGIVLYDLKQYQAAVGNYDKAVQIKPNFVEAYINRGVALVELRQLLAAVESYNKAIEIQPDHAGAHNSLGVALFELRQHAAAIASYDKAIRFAPKHADAYNNRGVALRDIRQSEAALASYDKAIAINPGHADAYCNRGNALGDLRQLQAAVDSYDKALALRPNYAFLDGTRLHAKMQICNWTNVEREIAALAAKIEGNEQVSPSFPVLAFTDSLTVQRKAAAIWANDKCPPNAELGPVLRIARRDKIRIGYYSADFYDHATAYLMAGLFECHDRDRFAFYGFSFGPDTGGDMRRRIAAAFGSFIDVRVRSDKEVAALSRSLEIDIAVDLKGFTQDERAGIFAHRAAPVQVSYIGYPGTMAVDYMDYIIADPTVIPDHHKDHYTEKVVHLPGSYQVNDAKRKIADKLFTRAELGLPAEGFVFCCFNNSYKITPGTFDVWMRILKQVRGSVLWLFEDNAAATANLRKEAQRRGVDPKRLVFAQRMSAADHLARHRVADLFLDTLPYNAHTTASDALWTGLPVLTCPGGAFAGRVAASLLTAVGLPELITSTLADYEALAMALATDPVRLGLIRDKLARNRLTAPLFDTAAFARHIEAAYTQMYERHHAGLPPDHLHVRA